MKRKIILGSGLLFFLAGAANAQVVLVPPEKGERSVVLRPVPEGPPLTVRMQSPPPISLSPPDNDESGKANRSALAQFDVELTLNGERLWSGLLRVDARMGANVDQNIRQPSEPCGGAADTGSRFDNDAQRISVRIDRLDEREEPDSFRVTASVVRPIPACEGGGSLTLGFTRSPTILPGQSAVLDGDGKLKVKLSRKR